MHHVFGATSVQTWSKKVSKVHHVAAMSPPCEWVVLLGIFFTQSGNDVVADMTLDIMLSEKINIVLSIVNLDVKINYDHVFSSINLDV